jgi:hypothetical protein
VETGVLRKTKGVSMSKDPAFLFYPNDYLGGTMGMTFEMKGAYIDLLIFQFNNHQFTESQAKQVVGSLWDNIKHKFTKEDEEHYYNERLRIEKEKRQNYTESRRQSRLKCDEDNVRIYLLKDLDNGLFKIGSSVNPTRRYNEITNQTKSVTGSSDNRNYKLTWYSEPTIRKIENELHNLFQDKRIEGEWFKITNTDIYEIKSIIEKTYVKSGETYVERTMQRTGNENENKDKIKDKILHLDAVLLTDIEYQKLITKYGKQSTEKAIEILNNAIMSKGYKYKSHYHTIIGWPMKEAQGGNNGTGNATFKRQIRTERDAINEAACDEADRIARDYYAKHPPADGNT